MKFGEYWYLSGGCDNIFSQHFIIKSLKYTVRLKNFHSEPPPIPQLDSTVNILPFFHLYYLPIHVTVFKTPES